MRSQEAWSKCHRNGIKRSAKIIARQDAVWANTKRNYKPSNLDHVQGDRECDRRKRQIANGQIKVENGLVA